MSLKHIIIRSSLIIPSVVCSLALTTNIYAAQSTAKGGTTAKGEQQTKVYVQLKNTKLRSQPTMWSPAVADLKYGDSLAILAPPETGWLKAKSVSGKSGFVPVSAVTEKKVVLSSVGNKGSVYTDPSEVVLAGKGFSKQIEEDYAKSQGVNYSAVNALERQRVNFEEVRQFARAGKLQESK